MSRKAATPKPDPSKNLEIDASQYGGKSKERIVAEISQSPIGANTVTAKAFSAGTFGPIGMTDAMSAMREKVARVKNGNMEEMESLLVAQATSLDAIYNELARRAALNMGEYIGANRNLYAHGAQGAVAVSGDRGGSCRDKEPAPGGVREASQHRAWAAAGEQRDRSAAADYARGR